MHKLASRNDVVDSVSGNYVASITEQRIKAPARVYGGERVHRFATDTASRALKLNLAFSIYGN